MPAPTPGPEIMPAQVQLTAVVLSVLLLLVTVELIRRNRLREDYALLWLGGAVILLVLSLWPQSIALIARLTGVIYPPSAVFLAAIVTIVWLLLHFSVIVSTLTARLIRIAQRTAVLEMRLAEFQAALTARGTTETQGQQ
ncbi:MAG: DUF2304 domain-containing protein [Armatimonadetes bacterium]|nr:DUF2304 domain-containing protein [Armatimonadota bacterium]